MWCWWKRTICWECRGVKNEPLILLEGTDKLIRGAEIKVHQRNSDKMLTLKRPLKYLVPFEIMDADKREKEK